MEGLNKFGESDFREIFRHKMARFRRNTLCISRKRNEFVAEKIRKAPKTHLFRTS